MSSLHSLSRRVRSSTTTFVNGDDMVPRTSPASLFRFRKRLEACMPKGKGLLARGAALTSFVGIGMARDAAQVASHSVKEMSSGAVRRAPGSAARKRGRKGRRARDYVEDVEAGDPSKVTMVLPGRVVFVKPRRARGGASLSVIKAASVKRDIFWQLDDVLVSKSMWRHHRIESYVRTLERV